MRFLWRQWLVLGQVHPLSEGPRMELVQPEDGVFLYSIVRNK
jgi:hypothetical protein